MERRIFTPSNPSGAPFEIFIFLLPFLKNSKSDVDDRGHRLRSGSPVTNLPGATAAILGFGPHIFFNIL